MKRGDVMDKKAIFFDIDGTLYDNDAHGVLDETKKVLKQLSKREDVDCYLATGRSYPAVLFLKDILPYFKGFNLANGSYVEYKGKLLFEKPLDPLFLKKIRSFL
jgi:HAD superfamily hydrolase (TIGR01484 family)